MTSDSHLDAVFSSRHFECRRKLIFKRPFIIINVKSIRRDQRNRIQEIRKGEFVPNGLCRCLPNSLVSYQSPPLPRVPPIPVPHIPYALLYSMLTLDIVERFHLSLLLTLILIRNFIEHTNSLTTPLKLPWMDLCMPFVMVLGSELLVDWCKHAFVTKFNHIRPSIYERFMDVLCLDFVKDGREVCIPFTYPRTVSLFPT